MTIPQMEKLSDAIYQALCERVAGLIEASLAHGYYEARAVQNRAGKSFLDENVAAAGALGTPRAALHEHRVGRQTSNFAILGCPHAPLRGFARQRSAHLARSGPRDA